MSMQTLRPLIPAGNEYCVLRSDVVDRLLSCGDGDGALLYLYLIRNGLPSDEHTLMRALNFSRERYDRAVFTLNNLNIASAAPAAVRRERSAAAPRYTVAELRARRTDDKRFDSVCQTAESALGRILTDSQLRTLYAAYDYLALPADVLIDMLTWLKQEKGTPSRRDIEETAYLWADMGIYSAEASAAFLSRKEREKPLMQQMLRALDMAGREPSPSEYRYLEGFIRQGFTPDAVELAKQRQYERIGKFSWKYLKGILDNWHDKGIHTVEEITAAEPQSASRQPQTYPPAQAQPDKLSDWEKDLLQQYSTEVP